MARCDNQIRSSIDEIIRYVGDDPDRPGLETTCIRVVDSYHELFSGYIVDIPGIFTTFPNEDTYDEIILLKNIEFVSMCEHHMLPFMGVAHIAYIPSLHIVGISKLARLLEAYSRRLQMQERICTQVVAALQEHLQPLGAACILEAKHCCISCRGISKQHATMVTSKLSGAFFDRPTARSELLSLIKD